MRPWRAGGIVLNRCLAQVTIEEGIVPGTLRYAARVIQKMVHGDKRRLLGCRACHTCDPKPWQIALHRGVEFDLASLHQLHDSQGGDHLGYGCQVDASTDVRAESFGREVLSPAPEDAILFATGDRAVFALWYFHFALGERPDLAVLAVDLLHFDWYEESLCSTYPTLVIPNPFPWPETVSAANPTRPVRYAQYEDGIVLECSLSPASP